MESKVQVDRVTGFRFGGTRHVVCICMTGVAVEILE